MRAPLIFSGVAMLLVAGAIIAGFSVLGTPGEVRLRRLDQQRVANLQAISNAITTYHTAYKALPESLAKMQGSGQWQYLILKDPISGEPYEYKIGDGLSYDLCAKFSTEASNGDAQADGSVIYIPPSSPFWGHKRGRHCYAFRLERH